jgi:hypothetical protein
VVAADNAQVVLDGVISQMRQHSRTTGPLLHAKMSPYSTPTEPWQDHEGPSIHVGVEAFTQKCYVEISNQFCCCSSTSISKKQCYGFVWLCSALR